MPIETERLAVRRMEDGDLGDFLEYEQRPEHTRYLARGPYVEGRGLATEASRALVAFAFADIGLHRITAHCDAANERSRRMMERLGMRREAHFRHAAFFDGVWHDQYLYAMLEEEWIAEIGENA